MPKLKFDYDRKYDNLFMHVPGSKSADSVLLGDLVLDFDKKKNLVGMEFTNASRFVSRITSSKDTAAVKELLAGLKECRMDVVQENEILTIRIHLVGKSSELTPVLSVPFATEPAIACA